jgi:hypothetical protein
MIRGWAVLTLLLFPQDAVEPLARDLESSEIPKIYHAVANLSALGEKAIPQLEARAKDAKGRVRDYLQLAADEIRAAGLLTGIPAPKRITMKSADRNVIELLGELRTKTGLAIALENLLGEEKMPEIPVDFRDATALEAFDAICKAGNVSILMDNGQIMLYQGDYQELPRFFYDHYFFRLGSFVVAKTADFRRPAVQSFRIQMEMLWNPVAAPCRFTAPVVVEALDDKGKSLLMPPEAPRKKDDPDDVEDEPGAVSMLQLLPPSSGSEKISVLRGFSTVALPRTRVSVSFGEEKKSEPPASSALEGLVRKSDGFTIKVGKVEPALYRVIFDVSSAQMKPDDISKLPFQASIVLKGGETTRCFISPSANKDAAEVTVAFQPLHLQEALVQAGDDRPPPPPVIEKIELSIVTAVQQRRIPFEFRDVKLK